MTLRSRRDSGLHVALECAKATLPNRVGSSIAIGRCHGLRFTFAISGDLSASRFSVNCASRKTALIAAVHETQSSGVGCPVLMLNVLYSPDECRADNNRPS